MVNVTVDVSSAPVLASVTPPPGDVSRLYQITTRFSEPVSGVEAADLLINGRPATGVTGSGAIYTFSFAPPPEGSVFVGWEGRHGIVNFENPPKPFDSYGAGATWQYNYTDTVAPVVAKLEPTAGATLRSLRTIEVTFDEPVSGVDASDLRVNGIAALRVTGVGAGPYQFEVVEPADKLASLAGPESLPVAFRLLVQGIVGRECVATEVLRRREGAVLQVVRLDRRFRFRHDAPPSADDRPDSTYPLSTRGPRKRRGRQGR